MEKTEEHVDFSPYTDKRNGDFLWRGNGKAEKPECRNHLPTSVPEGDSYSCGKKIEAAEIQPSYHYGSETQTVYKKTARTGDSHTDTSGSDSAYCSIRSSGSWNHNL